MDKEMNDQVTQNDTTPEAPNQAQLYEDLRRIGQLEDNKQDIQREIDERTERLRSGLAGLDKSSLLYKMLSSALKPPATAPTTERKSATRKKSPRKKAARKKRS